MTRLIFCFCVLAFHTSTYSQTEERTTKMDFNKDGIIDQIIVSRYDGSTVVPKTVDVQYFDGKTKKKDSLSLGYSLGSFFSVLDIPNAMNKSARTSIGNILFGSKDSIDPSLNWLIDFSSSRGVKYNPIWILGEPE